MVSKAQTVRKALAAELTTEPLHSTPSKAAPTAGALFALARELEILGPGDGSRAQPKRGIASSRGRGGRPTPSTSRLVFCARLRPTYQSTVTGRVIPKGCQGN